MPPLNRFTPGPCNCDCDGGPTCLPCSIPETDLTFTWFGGFGTPTIIRTETLTYHPAVGAEPAYWSGVTWWAIPDADNVPIRLGCRDGQIYLDIAWESGWNCNGLTTLESYSCDPFHLEFSGVACGFSPTWRWYIDE